MFGLDNILEVIESDPLTRWLLAAMALRAAWSVVCWRKCRLSGAAADDALEVIEAGAFEEVAAVGTAAQRGAILLAFLGPLLAGLAALGAWFLAFRPAAPTPASTGTQTGEPTSCPNSASKVSTFVLVSVVLYP